MTRRESREIAFSIIFQKGYLGELGVETIIEQNVESEFYKISDFAKNLAEKTIENLEEIDDIISKNLVGWSAKRISKVANAILRLTTCEILFSDDVPINVAINEAVEIAKKFSTKEDASYINGVLGTIAKTIDKTENAE